MPQRLQKICAAKGCNEKTRNPKYCDKHAKSEEAQRQRFVDQRRGSSSARGYGWKWKNARTRFLREHPLCEMCSTVDSPTTATVVDHRVPHKGDEYLFWNEENWQPLCASCHSRKTAAEDGGFGNKQRTPK